MGMYAVLESFNRLCDTPAVWAILGLVALRATWSLIHFAKCPVVRQTAHMDAASDRAAIDSPFVRSPRYLVTMLVGLVLSIGGLYALRQPDFGPIAVGAIMLGVFLLIVEPSRLVVEENTRRVSASRLDGEEAYAFAIERLRASHLERIVIEFGMAALLAALILLV